MVDDLTVGLSKVSAKGQVRIPYDVRERLDLQPGTKMIVMIADDMVVLRKADFVFQKEPTGILGRIRSVFSKLPIKDIETEQD